MIERFVTYTNIELVYETSMYDFMCARRSYFLFEKNAKGNI